MIKEPQKEAYQKELEAYQKELNDSIEEVFCTRIDFNLQSDQLFNEIKTKVLQRIGYREQGHFKRIEDIRELLKTEGGLDAIVSLLTVQVNAFKKQSEAVGELFNIVDKSQEQDLVLKQKRFQQDLVLKQKGFQQNLVLKQEEFRDRLIKDSGLTEFKAGEADKAAQFIFKILQPSGKGRKKEVILQRYKTAGAPTGAIKEYHLSADVNNIKKLAFMKIKKKKEQPLPSDRLDELRTELEMHRKLLDLEVPHIPELFFDNIPERKSVVKRISNFMNNLFRKQKIETPPPSEYYMIQENFDKDANVYLREVKDLKELRETNFKKIAKFTSETLQAAHAENICFFDIKPGNLLIRLDEEGENVEKAALTDFGGAVEIPAGQGSVFVPTWTERYVAPEVLENGEGNTSSDIFSYGTTLAELRYGKGNNRLFKKILPRPADNQQYLKKAKDEKKKNVLEKYKTLSGKKEAEFDKTDEMIVSMLDPDPQKRPSADEVARFFG